MKSAHHGIFLYRVKYKKRPRQEQHQLKGSGAAETGEQGLALISARPCRTDAWVAEENGNAG